jgi:uncharacterized repeat protein (TIGR03803 family)
MFLASPALGAGKYKVLHIFGRGNDANTPSGPLTLDKQGNLYGVTYGGGPQNSGTVFQLASADGRWTEKVLHAFRGGSDGAVPVGNLVTDEAGNWYGTMNGIGVGQGAIFELKHVSNRWTVSLIYEHQAFSPGLLLDKAGDLIGFIGAGDYGAGAVGKLAPGTKGWTYTQFYSFCSPTGCPDGEVPNSPLSWDVHGNLYGTTLYGGNGSPNCPGNLGCGVAFQMTPNSDGTWTYHVMHRFANFPSDGQYPSGLVLDASGSAYGVTGEGGVHKQGTVFKMTPSTGGHWKQTVLYDFPNCAEGCFPGRTLVFDKAGNLYGVNNGGLPDCGYTCGVVFKLAPQKNGKWTYSVVHKFTGKDGAFPWGVIVDGKGNIFGTTENGGKYNVGVAFEITP